MVRARIMFPGYQDQEPTTEAPVFTASHGRHPGWCQHRRQVAQQLYDLGETQHTPGQARATEGHHDWASITTSATFDHSNNIAVLKRSFPPVLRCFGLAHRQLGWLTP